MSTGPRSVRPATAQDVEALQGIEAAADALFEPLLGPEPFGPDSAEAGSVRIAQPGFVLVVAAASDGPALGFAHVLHPVDPALPQDAHLEQLAVHPDHLRRGHGRALVAAAGREARSRGAARMTLRTFAHVPWNAPFYAECGFVPVPEPGTAVHETMIAVEESIGLPSMGERVLMAKDLRQGAVPPDRRGPAGT